MLAKIITPICYSLKCLLKLAVPNLLNMYVLAKFLTNLADSGHVALAESSVQGLQCLPIYYTKGLSLKCLLELAVPNLPNMYVLTKYLTSLADAG